MAKNGSRGEVMASAVDITHQMFIHISLPRHFVIFLLLPSFVFLFCFDFSFLLL